MAKKTPKKKRKPQDATQYSLRGIRNDIAGLDTRLVNIERYLSRRVR